MGGAARNLIAKVAFAEWLLKPVSAISELLVWIFYSSIVGLSATVEEQDCSATSEVL